MKKTGIELIAEERQRQIEVEGYDKKHDSGHTDMELAGAAACYISGAINKDYPKFSRFQVHKQAESHCMVNSDDRGDRRLRKAGWYDGWPWGEDDWFDDKRDKHDKINLLKIAGAFIAAQIDIELASSNSD